MKRTLSIILALLIALSAVSFTVFAESLPDSLGEGDRVSGGGGDLADSGAVEDLAESSGKTYNIWVGNTQVTDNNKNDILGGNSGVRYNPSSNILTLSDNSVISGYHTACIPEEKTFLIYSEFGISLKGSYHMTETGSDNIIDYAVGVGDGNLSLSGDFRFNSGIMANNNVLLNSGTVTVYKSDSTAAAIESKVGYIDIGNNCLYVRAQGMRARNTIKYKDSYLTLKPETLTIDSGNVYDNGKEATWVVFESNDITFYDIWLGHTQVTSRNKDDILGKTKARYDADTATLYLDSPDIKGTHVTPDQTSAKIYCGCNVTIEDTYHMGSTAKAESQYGMYSPDGQVKLNGSFTFCGDNAGIFTNDGLTISGGSVAANATSAGGEAGQSVGIAGNVTIGENATRVEAQGFDKAFSAGVDIGSGLGVTKPQNAQLDVDNDLFYIYESDGTTIAKHAVIEPMVSSLSGTVTSFLGETDPVTVELKKGETVVDTKTVTGNLGDYSFADIDMGKYTLSVSKHNHAAREYEVIVNGETTQDITINPLGDVTLNGIVDIKDVNALYKHVMETKKLADPYALQCGDVTKDFKVVDIKDVNKLYKHVMETDNIWTEILIS